MRPNNETNEKHLESPKPGDFWHEMFCAYHTVLAVTESGVVITDTKLKVDAGHYTFDISAAKEITHEAHAKLVRYSSYPGFWADVVPERCMAIVAEWVAAGSQYIKLDTTPEQIAASARDAAIEQMIQVDPKGSLSRTYFCGLLYDAGYRKKESP